MKKGVKIAGISVVSLALACLLGLIITGAQIGWGPFASLYSWDKEVNPIAEKYDAEERQGEIIFYGASNFRLWPEMEEDLSEYRELTQMVNDELEEYCNTKDYMYFVDSEDMTYQNGEYREDLFIKDGIHLNHTGQLLWRDEYIKPALDKVIKENNLSNVMR